MVEQCSMVERCCVIEHLEQVLAMADIAGLSGGVLVAGRSSLLLERGCVLVSLGFD